MTKDMPGWLVSINIHVANVLGGLDSGNTNMTSMQMNSIQMSRMQPQQYNGFWFILLFVVIQLVIGFLIFFPGIYRKIAVYSGILLALIFWIIGQSFGGIFTGLATDLNTGPIILLLGLVILSIPNIDKNISKLIDKLEKVLT